MQLVLAGQKWSNTHNFFISQCNYMKQLVKWSDCRYLSAKKTLKAKARINEKLLSVQGMLSQYGANLFAVFWSSPGSSIVLSVSSLLRSNHAWQACFWRSCMVDCSYVSKPEWRIYQQHHKTQYSSHTEDTSSMEKDWYTYQSGERQQAEGSEKEAVLWPYWGEL